MHMNGGGLGQTEVLGREAEGEGQPGQGPAGRENGVSGSGVLG